MIVNKAKYKDAKMARKVIKKAKSKKVKLKFSHLDDWKNLHLEVFTRRYGETL